MSRKKQAPEPLELEIMPAHEIVMRKFIVTAFTIMPVDHLKDEPQIREEIEADSASAASVVMLRMHRHPRYYYMTVRDITPPKKRRSHVESFIGDEESEE